MQNEVAVECAADGSFVRLVWLPPGIEPGDERQRDFINRLRSDHGWNENADLLETSIESLKTEIDDRLSAFETLHKKERQATLGERQPARVYLICDRQDEVNVLPLRDFLFGKGFEVVLPLFDGEEAEVRLDHEDNLRSCDAAIIYHGLGHDLFLRRRLRELRKNPAATAAGGLRVSVVCMAPPMTTGKQSFRTLEALLVQQSGGFDPDAWQPFFSQLRAKSAGA